MTPEPPDTLTLNLAKITPTLKKIRRLTNARTLTITITDDTIRLIHPQTDREEITLCRLR